MNATIGKVMGWGQFALQLLAQLQTTGLPHGGMQWAALVGSVAVAVGMHASSATDGVK